MAHCPTNVTIAFLQQDVFFSTWWARSQSTKPVGLSQRFLFSFGCFLPPGKLEWTRFMSEVTLPFLEEFCAIVLRRLGPQSLGTESFSFRLSAAQEEVLSELEILVKMCSRRDGVHSSLREAFPKALYWLGTALLSNHIANHAVTAVLNQTDLMEWPRNIDDGAFVSAVAFLFRRYLFGQAVLAVCVDEQVWCTRELESTMRPGSLMPLLLRLLRGLPNMQITTDNILDTSLELKRLLRGANAEMRKLAIKKIEELWQLLKDLRLGDVEGKTWQDMTLTKHAASMLAEETRAWLRRHRVPLSSFGNFVAPQEQLPSYLQSLDG